MKNYLSPIFTLARWIFGIFFLLLFIIYFKESPPASISFFVLGILVTPLLTNIPGQIIGKPIKRIVKALLFVLFFALAINFSPPINTVVNTTEDDKHAETEPNVVADPNILDSISSGIDIKSEFVSPTSEPEPTPTPRTLYPVTKVVDGDTLDVLVDGQSIRIRLIGMDTPEIVDPRKPVQCFAKEASGKAKELLSGKNVSLEADITQGDKDTYGRYLRYIFLEDGTHFNKLMIEQGYAHEYTYKLPYKYRDEFIEAQKKARETKVGLWADNACPTPTLKPTLKPTSRPMLPTSTPYTQTPAQSNPPQQSGSWVCDCSKTCPNMSSCAEAQYQLNVCGCQARDGDKDGIACDIDCQ